MSKKTLAIIIGGLIVLGIIFWVVSFVLKPPVVEEVGPWPGMPPSDFEGTLRVIEWEGYEDPTLWNVGESAFKKIYPNVDVEFIIIVDEEKALSKIQAGVEADLVHECVGSVIWYYNEGAIEPLDISLIPNFEKMHEVFKEMVRKEGVGTPVAGEIYIIPADWGHSTIMYRNDLLDEAGIPENERDTYKLLLDPRLKGKIMIMDSPDEVYPLIALAAGIPKEDIWTLNDEQLEILRQKLLELKPLVKYFWEYPEDIIEPVAAGEIAAVNIWGESYLTLKGMGVDVTFGFPREGILTWVCGFSPVKGLKERDPDLYKVAHAFINAWLDEQAGANMIDMFMYGNPNVNAAALAKEKEIVKDFRYDDPEVLYEGVFWSEVPEETLDKIYAIWDEVFGE